MEKSTFKSKLKWWMRSFVKEMKMGKYKAVFRYFYDSQYRSNINHLMDLLCWGKLKMEEAHIRLEDIYHSHEVNYPGWVEELVQIAQDEHAAKLPLMKVLWDYERKLWIVIDGNHRLAALRRVHEGGMIKVNLLRRPDHPELDGPRSACWVQPQILKPREFRL